MKWSIELIQEREKEREKATVSGSGLVLLAGICYLREIREAAV